MPILDPYFVTIAVIAVLPGSLDGPTGTVGVSFGNASGAWSASNDIAASTPFDPSQELQLTVPPGGAVYLWLGALLTVPSGQAAGSYSGTVTLSARAS